MKTNITKILFLLTLAFAFWCMAENFIANPALEKRKSLGQIKQEIIELLAQTLQKQSKIIELHAQIQQEFYLHVEQLAQGEKKSFFTKATRADLLAYKHKIQAQKEFCDKEIEHLSQYLQYTAKCKN